jgi:hypothetical protein
MNEIERTLRSWWNNFRDVHDENGFNHFSHETEIALREQLRAQRTDTPIRQVRRESLAEAMVSGIMAAIIGGAGTGKVPTYHETEGLRTVIQSIVRTALYRENTSRRV